MTEEMKIIKRKIEEIKKLYLSLPDSAKLDIYDFVVFRR